jgi:hypothetical protein
MFKRLNELEREVGGEQRPLWKRTPLPLKFFILFGFVSYTVQRYLTYSPPVDPTPSTMAYFVGPIDALIQALWSGIASRLFSSVGLI